MARRRSAFALSDNPILALAPDLWWQISDTSTLFQNSGGTGVVANDTDPVGYLGNKGSASITPIQGTAGNRPLYNVSGGLSFLTFDGSNDELLATLASPLTWSSFYACIAVRLLAGIAGHDRILAVWNSANGSGGDFSNTDGWPIVKLDGSAATLNIDHAGQTNIASGLAITTGVDYVIESYWNGSQHQYTRNGTSGTLQSISNNTAMSGTNRLCIGDGSEANKQIPMRFYGGVLFSRVPDSTERAIARSQIGAYAGLSL